MFIHVLTAAFYTKKKLTEWRNE